MANGGDKAHPEEKKADVKLTTVHFDGSGTGRTAFLGGHTDGLVALVSEAAPALKSDMARVIGIMDTKGNAQLPGVKTMNEQGYNVVMPNTEGIIAPAGTPAAILQRLESALKDISTDPAYVAQMEKLGIEVRFKGSKEAEEWMTQLENTVRPLILEERKKQQ